MTQFGDKSQAANRPTVMMRKPFATATSQRPDSGGPNGLTYAPVLAVKKPKTIIQAQNDRQKTRIIMDVVSMSTGVPLDCLRSQTRSTARAARARQICMYLAYVAFQWPLARIGRAFGRDRTTAGYACRLIEDMRDDHGFDERLSRLEACLENMPGAMEVKLLSPNLREMSA